MKLDFSLFSKYRLELMGASMITVLAGHFMLWTHINLLPGVVNYFVMQIIFPANIPLAYTVMLVPMLSVLELSVESEGIFADIIGKFSFLSSLSSNSLASSITVTSAPNVASNT